MTLRARDLTEIPPETADVGRKILRETHPYRVIGDHLPDIIQDEQFEDMYDPIGRDAVWPSVLGMVTIFQFQENLPDREAAEMVATRLDWKYALHLPLDYSGFDYSCLCYFRQRLLKHQQEALVFDTILNRVKALGFIKKRGKQRTDSLAVIGAVRQLTRLELVTETLRLAVRALQAADPAWVEGMVPASFLETYAHTRPDYQLTEAERKAAIQQTGQAGFWLLDQLDASGSETLRALAEVTTLRTVWDRQYERVAEEVTPRTEFVECKDLIVTPHDAGVRHGEKRHQSWVGEKVHVTETAEDDGPNFITDVTTANAASGDGEALPEIRENLAEREVTPGEHYVDAGYVSGKQMADSEAAGIVLMGPPLADTSSNGFKIADFTLDRTAQRATCPAGQTSVVWSPRRLRDGSTGIYVRFAAATCAACPLRAECTTSRQGRTLLIGEHYERLMTRRAEAQTAEFWEKMKARPAIEGTLSELVRKHGFRRHRYRGDAKRHFENLLKAAACNLKRLIRALIERWQKGLVVAATPA
jgi:transposase